MTGTSRRMLVGAGSASASRTASAAPRAAGARARRPASSSPPPPAAPLTSWAGCSPATCSRRWGQNAVAENKIGRRGDHRHHGGGTGLGRTATRMLMGNIGPQSIAYSLFRNLPYKPQNLIPVSKYDPRSERAGPASFRAGELGAGFVRLPEGRTPASCSYGTPGIGQSPHLSGVWFHQLTGNPRGARTLPRRRASDGRAARAATSSTCSTT